MCYGNAMYKNRKNAKPKTLPFRENANKLPLLVFRERRRKAIKADDKNLEK